MKPAAIAFVLLVEIGAGAGAQSGAGPRHLLVQVRDTAPQGPAAIRHGADGSYAVSTGGGGERDDRGAQAPDNGTTLSTSNRVRRVHIVEGERVRVDLPAVQSLQFHVPISAAGAGPGKGTGGATPAAGATGAGASNAATGAGSTGSGAPSASGVVTFEAVTAFAARFVLAGSNVRIELTPLRRRSVAAPYAPGSGGADRPVTVGGHLGEWIALGDTDLDDPAKSLNATAEPTSPASVWVRVDLEAAEAVK
jgi:hypothetical protein